MTVAIASYLPESMIIKIGPTLRLLDDQGKPVALPTAEVFGFFFHEYAHYIHNISTACGIAVFLNTLELWRRFRLTHDTAGYSSGSGAQPADDKEFLKSLLACLIADRRELDLSPRRFRTASPDVSSPQPTTKGTLKR